MAKAGEGAPSEGAVWTPLYLCILGIAYMCTSLSLG